MEESQRVKMILLGTCFILFSIITIGLFSFFINPFQTVGYTLAFIAGLSMIVLPCTLPLAFIIVPIAMSESPKKGLLMALLFGTGLIITFSVYGVVFSYAGRIVGLLTANVIAGILGGGAAYLFGLTELKLIKFKIPSYSGAFPRFLERQGDYTKVFLLGLILANVGVGCPNPAFYVLLAYVIGTANPLTGWSLMAVHGIGRALPLIFLAVLAIIGVNATGALTKRAKSVRKWTAIGLIVVGAILFVITGLFRGWFEESFIHEGWNDILLDLTGGKIGEAEELNLESSIILEMVPQWLGPYALAVMLAVPFFWYRYKHKKKRVKK
ncbi:MAG TPA: cytochrome c biogenesis protein CcdA [Candidatus Nanoarchaeia archaeon]|nr:cytochrome c biogenesis protein CcdA [Candidatus Nanoarchaeia archaeon]